jgi:hypothetical protein
VHGSKPRHGAGVNAEPSFAKHPEDYGQNDWKHIRCEKENRLVRPIAVVERHPKMSLEKITHFRLFVRKLTAMIIFKNLSQK